MAATASRIYTIELTSLLVEETLVATPAASCPLLARRPPAGLRQAEPATIRVAAEAPLHLVEPAPDVARPGPRRRSP